MGEFLGFLAGGGMLIFILLLALVFLRRMGWLSDASMGAVRQSSLMTLGMGCAYWLAGALIYHAFYGDLESAAEIPRIFRGAYVQRMFAALSAPNWFAPLSGLFAFMAHGLGTLLFGEYLTAGIALSWGMTGLALCLLLGAFTRIWGEGAAQNLAFFLLCLPGALFLFLPGWPPVTLLMLSLILFLLKKRFRRRESVVPSSLYGWALSAVLLLSATVVAGSAFGVLG